MYDDGGRTLHAEGRSAAGWKDHCPGENMPQYLVAIHHPEGYDGSLEGEEMVRDIDVLNEEMEAAGARFFAGGLQSAPHAKSLRKQPGGEVIVTDGPYLETREHMGGF